MTLVRWISERIDKWMLQGMDNWGYVRQWHPTPVFLPGRSHGWRSLVGCSPWGLEESDTTERLHFHFSLLCIGEGNGNPLQCSCLENPRDGVAQSRTQLKWLSSSKLSRHKSDCFIIRRQKYCHFIVVTLCSYIKRHLLGMCVQLCVWEN